MADKKTVDKVKELLDGHVYAPLKDAAEKWLAEADEKYGDKFDELKEKGGEAWDKLNESAEKFSEKSIEANEKLIKAGEKFTDAVEKFSDKAAPKIDELKEKVDSLEGNLMLANQDLDTIEDMIGFKKPKVTKDGGDADA